MMTLKRFRPTRRRAMALLSVLIIMTVAYFALVQSMELVWAGTRTERHRETARLLRFAAESGLQHGMFTVSEGSNPTGTYNSTEYDDLLSDGVAMTVTVAESALTLDASGNVVYGSAYSNPQGDDSELYDVMAQATDPNTGMTSNLHAQIRRLPQTVTETTSTLEIPKIFDYIYFLNNWAWFWGDTISAYGDSRSNGDFDLRSYPDVYGQLYAHGEIRGSAEGYGADPIYRHPGADMLTMPNLYNDFSYYETLAAEQGATLTQDGSTLVSAVHSGSIYLRGTADNPIVIDGPIVVSGDIVVGGYVTGQGAFYAGRNIYIMDDLQYVNGPSLNSDGLPRPENSDSSTPPSLEDRTAWVEANQTTDLVAYAARENILFGNIENSDWDYPWSYLDDWGDEHVGEDGIPGTDDDNVPFEHDWDGDGNFETSTWYDVDGDGVVDDNYSWDEDIAITYNENEWTNWPTDAGGNMLQYGTLADRNITRIDGIFYTNHVFSGRTRSGPDYINGAIICKDEAIIYSNRIHMSYDERIHSDFRDPDNNVVNIDLSGFFPVTTTTTEIDHYITQIESWTENPGGGS